MLFPRKPNVGNSLPVNQMMSPNINLCICDLDDRYHAKVLLFGEFLTSEQNGISKLHVYNVDDHYHVNACP